MEAILNNINNNLQNCGRLVTEESRLYNRIFKGLRIIFNYMIMDYLQKPYHVL